MENASSNERLEFIVRSTILDRPRLLTINREYFEFDDKERVSEAPTRFLKADIAALRYGVKAIRGYRFRIGRIYCIDVINASGAIIKIRLKSVYRVRRKSLGKKYQEIVGSLFKYYFYDMARDYLSRFEAGQPVELLGVSLDSDGVIFDKKIGLVSWDFLGTKRYWHYYTLFSEEKPENYRAFIFLDDWNAGVLRGLIETILKRKFPAKKID
jgi:hypothetical protein